MLRDANNPGLSTDTPWLAGRFDATTGPPQLLFGRMYEDAEIEGKTFPRGSRVFAIASSGCTAIRLSEDHEVTAVDINPVQLAYAERRAQGAPIETGSAERMMRLARGLFPLIGWTRRRLDTFFAMQDPAKQLAYWKGTLDTQRFVKTGIDLTPADLAAARWPLQRPPHQFETSLPRVFAVGDVRAGSMKRVAAAVGEGSAAVQIVHRVLAE